MFTDWMQVNEAGVAVYEAAEKAYRKARAKKGAKAAHTAASDAARKAGAALLNLSAWDVATTVQNLIDP